MEVSTIMNTDSVAPSVINDSYNLVDRQWAGCPQALQGRRCDSNEGKTRIWLLEDGTAEVSLGAEVSSKLKIAEIALPYNSSLIVVA